MVNCSFKKYVSDDFCKYAHFCKIKGTEILLRPKQRKNPYESFREKQNFCTFYTVDVTRDAIFLQCLYAVYKIINLKNFTVSTKIGPR
jgi:hypothetical protein